MKSLVLGAICLWTASALALPGWVQRLRTSPVELCVGMLSAAQLRGSEYDRLATERSLWKLRSSARDRASLKRIASIDGAAEVRMVEYTGTEEIQSFRDRIETEVSDLRLDLHLDLKKTDFTFRQFIEPYLRSGSMLSGILLFSTGLVQSALLLAQPPLNSELLKFEAATVILGVLGAYDCFIRRHDGFRFRHSRFYRWISRRSTTAKPGVSHWGTSISMPRLMVRRALEGFRAPVSFVAQEKIRRWTPGIFRLLSRESSQPKLFPLERLRIDMWTVTEEGQPPRLQVYFWRTN